MSTTRQFIEPMTDVWLPGVPSNLLTQLAPALVVYILSLLSASTELSVSQSSCMEARYGHSQNLSFFQWRDYTERSYAPYRAFPQDISRLHLPHYLVSPICGADD